MSVQMVNEGADELAQAAARYQAEAKRITADAGLSPQGVQDARKELRSALTEVVERVTTRTSPLLQELRADSENRLRELSRSADANEAVSRVAMALEQSHPGDLIGILTEDGDVAGLLALRQVAPSIAGRFTKVAGDRAAFAETLRHNVDQALLSTSSSDSAPRTVVAERIALDDAQERYQGAVNYAVTPDATGQLGFALSEALVNA